ncbi:MAG: hypothetical protein IPG73_05850 [Ignavibacteria bacterium]|nr:hypothetical protein [Ignavibacteria bacterium]
MNIDASNLSFTSNGGASTTMLVTGGANSGVAMTTAGAGTITMTGPTDVTGATTINTTGTANTTLGNTGVGATTVTLNAGTTGNIVLGGVDADAAPTEILTITATNEVRRSSMSGTALEGLVFSAGAYRLGGTTNVANPFLTSRFVNIDASNLSFTSNGGASTTARGPQGGDDAKGRSRGQHNDARHGRSQQGVAMTTQEERRSDGYDEVNTTGLQHNAW